MQKMQSRYKTITGICRNVDAEVTKTILVDEMRIRMEDIREIDSPDFLPAGLLQREGYGIPV